MRWGAEGAWNDGRGLAQCPVETGATVCEDNARRTAAGRRARMPGQRDSPDARASALVAWREAGTPPPVAAGDETGALDLLVAERDRVVVETARPRNQLHQLPLQLGPAYRALSNEIDAHRWRPFLRDRRADPPGRVVPALPFGPGNGRGARRARSRPVGTRRDSGPRPTALPIIRCY